MSGRGAGPQDATAVPPAPSCLSTVQQPGEAEVFVLRVIGGDGPVVLGKPPPPSVSLASGILAIHTLLTPRKWHQSSCWLGLSGVLWQMDR